MRIGTGEPNGSAGKVPGSKNSGNPNCDALTHDMARGTAGTDDHKGVFVGNGGIDRGCDQGVACVNWTVCTYAGDNGAGGYNGGRTVGTKGVSTIAGSALLFRGVGIPRGGK